MGPSSAAPARAAGAPHWHWPDPVEAAARVWELGLTPWLPTAARESLVQQRWDGLVDHARAHAPFYRDLYAALPPGPVAERRLLPVVTKPALMADLDRALAEPRLRGPALAAFIADPARMGEPFAGDCAVWTSSGTSATPGIFVHDARALAIYDAIQLCRFFGLGAGWLRDPQPLGAARYALVAATGGHFAGVGMVQRLRSLFPLMRDRWRSFSLMQPVDQLVAQLNAFAPDTLASYPSAAVLLAQEQRAGRLAIAPRRVWTGGECLGAPDLQAIAGAFGATVREEYGASEFPSIAIGCEAGALHVNADWVVLEPVDDHYRPVPAGVASHSVLLTNLANRALPLIRYDLGDSVTLLREPCACGSPLPAIRVLGRVDDCLDLAAADGRQVRLLPLVLATVFEESAGTADFQLAQCTPDGLRLWPGTTDPARAAQVRTALFRHLQSQHLESTRIDLCTAPLWPRGPGGKVRRIRRCVAGEFRGASSGASSDGRCGDCGGG